MELDRRLSVAPIAGFVSAPAVREKVTAGHTDANARLKKVEKSES